MIKGSNDSSWKFPALYIALVLIWGSAFTMVGVGVDYIAPIWLVAYRLIIGAMLVTTYAYFKGEGLPKLSDVRWRWYGLLGLTGSALPFFLLSIGQMSVDSGLTSIIVGSMPLMTIILAHFFAQEYLTPQKLIGFVIGFIGIVILFLPEDLSLKVVTDWRAQLLIVFSAFLYAVTTIIAKHVPKTPSSTGAAMMLISAAIIASLYGIGTGLPTEVPAAIGLWMMLGLAIGSTAIATIMYLYVVEQKGPSMMAKINYFVPVTSVFFGCLLLGEEFSWRIALSFCIIAIGVMISQAKSKPKDKPKPAAINP